MSFDLTWMANLLPILLKGFSKVKRYILELGSHSEKIIILKEKTDSLEIALENSNKVIKRVILRLRDIEEKNKNLEKEFDDKVELICRRILDNKKKK